VSNMLQTHCLREQGYVRFSIPESLPDLGETKGEGPDIDRRVQQVMSKPDNYLAPASAKPVASFGVDAAAQAAYEAAVNGSVDQLLEEDNKLAPERVKRLYWRKALAEAANTPMDRKKNPQKLRAYEDVLLNQATSCIQKQNTQQFHLRIAFVQAGRLHAQEVFLFRLIDKIKQANYSGVIHVTVIDKSYQEVLTQGLDASFEQFKQEMTAVAPQNTKIHVSVFASHVTYQAKINSGDMIKADLMYGKPLPRQTLKVALLSMSVLLLGLALSKR
jgi:hypothetical protein